MGLSIFNLKAPALHHRPAKSASSCGAARRAGDGRSCAETTLLGLRLGQAHGRYDGRHYLV